ncbi:MAG: dihydrofolate reductase [Saprospiraceae bacterium]
MHKFIIAAVADNGVIGNGGDLIWNLPADQAFFLNRIKNALLISGRTSYESGHGSVVFQNPKRLIILTAKKNYQTDGAYLANSIQEAKELSKELDFEELAVLGGEKVYAQLLDWVDTLYITEIHENFVGDTFFPKIDPVDWKETQREDMEADAQNPHAYSFVTYKRTSRTNVNNAEA